MRVGTDVLAVGACLLAAVFMPVFALIMSIVWARDQMRAPVRPDLIATAVISVAMLAIPPLRLGVFGLLYG